MSEFTAKERTRLADATMEIGDVTEIIEFTDPGTGSSENLDTAFNHLKNVLAELECVRHYTALYLEEKKDG